MEKLYSIWKNTFWRGDGDDFHYKITHRSQKFTSFLNPKTPSQLRPLTVVLHGPAGVGKTTLAKKWMLDWTQDNLPEALNSTFYLSCKELNHKGTCTFAELMSKYWPDLQKAGPEILAQAQKILFIIDGFDELRVPAGSLIHDICGDWKKQKPVPVLLGSLLKRKILPKATLLITTRPGALRELRLLLEQPLFIEIEGLLELERREYFLKHFVEEDQALRAFNLMKSNPTLFHMGSAPAVCWIVCTCLKLQMEKGEDPAPTCQTTTSLFLRFLCSQFTMAPGSCPRQYLAAPVKALCVLAAEGIWTQTSVFDGEDLGRLAGGEESDLRPFLDKNILQKGRDCGSCYSFIHLSVQQFLAAMFYVLESEEEEDGESCRGDIGDVQKLLSKEERLKNPNLTHVVYFLFGLLNEKRARELETTFGCRVSMGVKQELLKSQSGGKKPFSSMMGMKEVVYCLYESQEEQLVKDAMVHVKEMSLHLKNKMDVVHSSFCLKHCQNLQKISLQVEKGIFLENDTVSESDTWVERSLHDHHTLCLWTDLCSVFSSNKKLSFLDVGQSFLSHSSVRILCEQITRVTCHLQKVVIKNISPAKAYQDFCLAFIGKKTLTHLTLEGSVHSEKMLLLLCETLKHSRCNLQYLSLGSCSNITQQWDDFSLALKINQSLKCLDLMASELLDEGVKLLCTTLRHPKCFLQRLSLENCHLTEACCKELSSALIVNQRLTHLCLAKNNLGDGGVKLLCEGLSYPECQLQTLVLWHCNITRHGCKHISKLLQGDSSLTHLDLGLNPIATGLWFLCDALKKPNCNLKYLGQMHLIDATYFATRTLMERESGSCKYLLSLAETRKNTTTMVFNRWSMDRVWLCSCSITSFCCQDLASALTSNQRLETLDLGQNILGKSGIMVLFEALKQNNGPLKTLRLKTDESTVEVQKLLKEVNDSNPKLTINWKDSRTSRSSYCDFFS